MKIELKKIAFYERMSEETNAFNADIYVNGIKTGYAKNDGQGGCTWYHPYEGKQDLLKQAEAYAKSLPSTSHEFMGKTMVLDTNLESIIDDLLGKHLIAKENEKFQKKIQKSCLTNIVWGVENGSSFRSMGWKNVTIEQLLNTPNGIAAIKNAIARVKREMKEGEKIFNNNIPIELYQK